MATTSLVILLCAMVIGVLSYKLLKPQSSKPKPPGPRRFPLIGNVPQMPACTPWLTFSEWRKKYGDIIHVDIFGKPLVIINSAQAARDLLDKRSSLYSDRPRFVMAGDLTGYAQNFVLLPYGDNWRNQRKLVSHDFSQGMVPRYYPLQEKEAHILVRNILKDAASLKSQIQLHIGIIIVRVLYGYYIQDEKDPFLTLTLEALDNFSAATLPGNFMVDFIPSLKYLPSWMPGSGFLSTAAEWKKIVWDSSWDPYLWSKKHLVSGEALTPNLCGTILQEAGGELSPEAESCLVWAASAVLGGGMDTNISTALTFFLAMVLHPEIQRKAQAEVDAVTGSERLPNISDRASLPYVRSVFTEALRWNPALPLGLPHAVTQDDIYNGMFIEKGTLVMPNVWQMLHDVSVYPDPLRFNPDRYGLADSEMQKVTDLVFGFGRRACPGSHFAQGTLYAIVLTTLATCDVLPALDKDGKEVIPQVKYTSGSISFPEPFQLRLRSRSSHAEEMLIETASASELHLQ